MSDIKIICSEDGSHTLYNAQLKETYHSTHGAMQESMHVFINAGFNEVAKTKENVVVFEVGYGTGLNALLVLREAIEKNIKVKFYSLEPYPLSQDIISHLNYADKLGKEYKGYFEQLHQYNSGEPKIIHPNFILTVYNKKLEEVEDIPLKADVVFFDAFAPNKQEEVWLIENLMKAQNFLVEEGVFVTYCAKGELKRNLKNLQMSVESLP
ncbi:MAG TPA: tRNA (5-methylaminomethyl-2-thiouridine)(34)-methyltransferase MnmD, partial [Cytophagaceae bacterium]